MFTLAQLTNFVAVAEELHFGRAATRLRMTQPPLSRQIQLLESELRVRLLDRANRSVRLTPAGKAFLTEARRILHQAESAALTVRQVSQGQSGSLTIGFTAASAHTKLGRLLESARARLPQVEIVLREMVTRDQVEALTEGSLDLGLLRPPVTDTRLDSRPAAREELLAAVPSGHRLAFGEGPLVPGDFEGQELLMYSPVEARYFHELLISIFRAAGVAPVYSQHLSQVHSMLALVAGGWGVALVPRSAAQLHYEGVTFRDFTPVSPARVELALAWPKASGNPALRALLRGL